MKYFEVKKVLIRLKSRKYLASECNICLMAIENESTVRMLNCYHIYHSECIEKWFIEHMNCPTCKKDYKGKADKGYNLNEFLQTINVDNECFYSDHLVKSRYKLAKTNSIIMNDPFYVKHNRPRLVSLDLAEILRKENYMKELREDESQ